MPGTAFGFPSYPQRPSVSPQAVGQMLSQNAAPQAAAPPQEYMGQAPTINPQDVGRALSDAAMDDMPIGGSPNVPSALHIAAREAATRAPAQMQGSQPTPPSPLSEFQLVQMGVTAPEIALLRLQGGIK